MPEKKENKTAKSLYRRFFQALFLILFLYLFRKTDYQGTDEITRAVNIFFRWNPLVAASAMLAARTFISLLIPAFIVAGLTLALGKFFCGWVCPLGTCLDVAHKIIRPRPVKTTRRYTSYKYYLLILILISSLFGISLVGYFDPFSILVRGMTLAIDPAFSALVSAPFDFLYKHSPSWVSALSEPAYFFLRKTVLPFKQSVFEYSLTSGLILLLVFAMEKLERRFWCRNLCPLGGMLALFARVAPLRLHPGKACKTDGCTTCMDICRMGAIDEEGLVSPGECNLCLDCIDDCPNGTITFSFKRPEHEPAPMGISRRSFAGMLATGIFLPAFFKVSASGKKANPYLIRPPGALEESEFLSRCVRCGECMKVCIGNALHPTLLDAGPEGIFSPVLIPRIGYCEYNCTLCGQVCPTGAIEKLCKKRKHKVRIGLAYFDKNRCLPWAKNIPCIVCEEMCPTHDKAIKLKDEVVTNARGEEVTVKRPYIVDELCIGCGICETRCPLQGDSAVIVTCEGESRDPEAFLSSGPIGY